MGELFPIRELMRKIPGAPSERELRKVGCPEIVFEEGKVHAWYRALMKGVVSSGDPGGTKERQTLFANILAMQLFSLHLLIC